MLYFSSRLKPCNLAFFALIMYIIDNHYILIIIIYNLIRNKQNISEKQNNTLFKNINIHKMLNLHLTCIYENI